jgi:hypothetical protein
VRTGDVACHEDVMVGRAFTSILALSRPNVSCSSGTGPASRGGDVTVARRM